MGYSKPRADNNKVAAVVPTFNRKLLLVQCLRALRSQARPPDHVYVIDNASTDGTQELLAECGFGSDPWVTLVRLPANTGGAGGFYEGTRRAHEAGYAWLWLMDDDSEPTPACLEQLLSAAAASDAGIVCPRIIGDDDVPQTYHHKTITRFGFEHPTDVNGRGDAVEVDSNAFVGPLVSARVFDAVGYPEPGLFIWGDDTEFMWRASKRFKIVVSSGATILHKEKRAAAGAKLAAWRQYYFIRNCIWMRRRHGTPAQHFFPVYIAARMILGRTGGPRHRIELARAFFLGLRSTVRPEWHP
jgi:GT2 family glycosyltransferase